MAADAGTTALVDFDRDIRPLLSENCFTCHGPDGGKRQAGLRLDQKDSAFSPLESGSTAIIPGNVDQSELVRRLISSDPDLVMPPPSEEKRLTPAQIQLIRNWIDQGATWKAHWSFEAVHSPPVPELPNGESLHPIDAFVRARLAREGLQPAPEETRERLIRRVSLDLTGLPPSLEEVDAFVSDPSPDAFEKVVDRLLQSPHHGERLALIWLDLARYGDTSGYHNDSLRDMWLWREWVVQAFNANLPFDEFTIQQLAGDLLPNSSVQQRIASGFHRNVMTSDEGGLIDAEYRNLYVVDRVATTGVTWLGMTIACAQCHDHKYDPVTQRDFYQVYAFFNNVPENGKDGVRDRNPPPFLQVSTTEQDSELARLNSEYTAADQQFQERTKGLSAEQITADPNLAELQKQLKDLKKKRDDFEKSIPSTMVMAELETPRETFMKVRGNYDQDGEKVSAGVPAFLPQISPRSDGKPLNRLDLARWLVSPDHPLTARVTMNRWWSMLFGTGLVRTLNDFGSQGERPSHPELLDWLAADLMRDWDTRRALRQIVLSRTYRQTSRTTAELQARDSGNRLLARGPRQRLDAEIIRDNALAIAGVLNPVLGGRSIKPSQPDGTWEINEMSGYKYEKSMGADLYRRGLYVYWRRSTVYPSFVTLDAPTREFCVAQRAKTSTPLQSLVLMNDPVFVEAARAFAQRILNEGGSDDSARLRFAWRVTLARPPAAPEMQILERTLQQLQTTYRQNPAAAGRLISVGDLSRPAGMDDSELAAWTAFSNVLLNLNETISN
jgi:hypothetical protein